MDCIGNGGPAMGLSGLVKAVKIQQDGSGTVLAETPTGLVEATIDGTRRPEFGDRIDISFDTARALLFDSKSECLVGRIASAADKKSALK